jgi:oxygen-dependent protoporphyrinogen oxidase
VRSAFPKLVAMEREHGSLVRGMRAQQRARRASNGDGREGSAFVSLGGGVGELLDAMVERLRAEGVELRRGAGIRALARAGSGWALSTHGGGALEADAVLLAIPPYAAARVAGTHDEALERMRVFVGGPLATEHLRGDDASLVALARSELQSLMGLTAEPVLSRVFRFERGSTQMRVGHAGIMLELRRRLAAVAPGVAIAGGGYDGIGIPDCIRQGQDAARTLIEGL